MIFLSMRELTQDEYDTIKIETVDRDSVSVLEQKSTLQAIVSTKAKPNPKLVSILKELEGGTEVSKIQTIICTGDSYEATRHFTIN